MQALYTIFIFTFFQHLFSSPYTPAPVFVILFIYIQNIYNFFIIVEMSKFFAEGNISEPSDSDEEEQQKKEGDKVRNTYIYDEVDDQIPLPEKDRKEDGFQKWGDYLKSSDPMIRRKYWLKREPKKVEKKKEEREEREEKEEKEEVEEGKATHSNQPNQNQNQKKQVKMKVTEIEKKKLVIKDVKEAEQRLRKIMTQFAKLGSQQKRQEHLENLDIIVEKSKKYKDFQKLSILLVVMPIRIQVTRQMNYTHFPHQQWISLFANLKSITNLLSNSEEDDLIENIIQFDENSQNQAKVDVTEKSIYQSLKVFIIVLEHELQKAFIFLENSEKQYGQRLCDLLNFVDFMYKLSNQLSFKNELEVTSAQLAFKVLENTYFMSKNFLEKINVDNRFQFATISDREEFSKPIFKMIKDQTKITKTLLYLVFNLAINREEKAKDLFVMSNILETIGNSDYHIHACFNRTLVQLGINAFCKGHMHETRQILSDLCSYGKSKEQTREIIKQLLGQDQKNEKDLHRNRCLPYYLHLNVDLIEVIQLIAEMLIEIPETLTEGGRITSKTLKKMYIQYEKSHFIAEPLNHRDLIYAASNQLKRGNWKDCYEKLLQISVWKELDNVQEVHQNLMNCIKETALRCYLLGNQKCFRCISLENLGEKFDLSFGNIRRLICRWINHREVQATISGKYLNMVNRNSSKKEKESELHKTCEKLFNRIEECMQTNEEMLKQCAGNLVGQEEEDPEKENKWRVRVNPAMMDKLKAILSRRT